jgi:predicted PurR-regulated permease PerM
MQTFKNLEIKNVFFLLILLLITYLAIQLFSPFINIILISLVVVQIFHPFYDFFHRTLKSKGFATFLSVIIVLIFFIVPLTFIVILATNEIQTLLSSTHILDNLGEIKKSIEAGLDIINKTLNALSSFDINAIIKSLNGSEQIVNQIFTISRDLLTVGGGILFNIFLFILSLIYIFPSYDDLGIALSKVSPLDDKLDLILFKKFKDTLKGVIRGSFLVAILQATAVIIPMILMQVGAPVLLWLIMVILSVVPVGSGLVWFPVGTAMIINGFNIGDSGQAILGFGLIIYSAVIINVIDSTFRPILMKNTVNLHPMVTIFSVLGGITIFGILGILYGPLIVVLFLSIMEIYRHQYLQNKDTAKIYDIEINK